MGIERKIETQARASRRTPGPRATPPPHWAWSNSSNDLSLTASLSVRYYQKKSSSATPELLLEPLYHVSLSFVDWLQDDYRFTHEHHFSYFWQIHFQRWSKCLCYYFMIYLWHLSFLSLLTWSVDPAPFIDGVRINSPHYLCKMVLKEAGTHKFTLVVSQYEKHLTIHYSLRIYSTCPFSLHKIKNYCKHKHEVRLYKTVSFDHVTFLTFRDE